jgi:hypothetical protein
LIAEPMAFNPYIIRRPELGGDMWARSLLGRNHGLVVLKGFSEWVAPEPLLNHRLLQVHDICCAYNRVSGRLLLANFTPESSLLVPVLFDDTRAGENGSPARAFVMISDEPHPGLRAIGIRHAPLSLGLEAAFEWLHPEAEPDVGESAVCSVAAAPRCAGARPWAAVDVAQPGAVGDTEAERAKTAGGAAAATSAATEPVAAEGEAKARAEQQPSPAAAAHGPHPAPQGAAAEHPAQAAEAAPGESAHGGDDAEAPFAIDFEAVLAEGEVDLFAFSLFKSA